MPKRTKKAWYKSKTIWINTLTAVVGVAGVVAPVIPAVALPYITAAVGAANIGLRMITNESVGGKDAVSDD